MTSRGVRLVAALLATCCAATGLAASARAATTTTSPSPDPLDPGAGVPRVVDRTVTDERITESSGLVTSRTLDGVLWTFNDSGGTPDLFGLGRKGTVVARVRVAGAQNTDWEAAAPVRLASGEPAVAVGDLGDNRADRPSVQVYVVREPRRPGETTQAPERTITLTYPDGPADAECLVADPRTNRLYVVTKGLVGGRLYAVPPQVWPGGRATGRTASAALVPLGRVPLGLVTDGVGLPDGRIGLRTYGELAVMPPVPASAGDVLWSPLATTPLPRQGQGEGLALARSRTAFFLSTEGEDKPVLRFVPPADVLAAGATAPAVAATGGGGRTASPTATSTAAPSAGRPGVTAATRRAVGTTFAVAGGVGAAVVLAATAVLLLLRRRRR